MGVCNLFKKFDSTNNNGQGILFTFSQYAEDLTMQDTLQRDHRVVPSKFVCLDLDINEFASGVYSTVDDINTTIPQDLQSYYENKISYLRGLEVEGEYTWDALDSSKFLFDFLKKYKLISEANIDQEDPTSNKYIPEVKYIGDINIYSNENEQNINYNEIYCMVPSDAMEYTYYLTVPETRIYSYDFDETPTELNGWAANYPSGTGLQNAPEFDSNNVYNTSYSAWMQALEPDAQDTEDHTDADSFTFNCIIILYDVISGNDENSNPIYLNRNLPLGIWFSGPAVETYGSFDLKNKVTKFVRSESIFNQGTSYGLRVCTKHIATPLGTAVVAEVGDYDHFHTEFAEVCDEFNRAAVEINNLAAETSIEHTDMSEFISEFVNRRVNVPYIRTIDNLNYWFVNGRNTGVVAGINVTPGGGGDVTITTLITLVTYNELLELRNSNALIPGMQYRITDYATTTTQGDTQSAGHQFDVIVTADSVNRLNESARAIQHINDSYFANSNLEAWELKYCLDNDTNRFAWADNLNGKGVIYYMKDEYDNEVAYDFKNITFDSGKYTFSFLVDNASLEDGSLLLDQDGYPLVNKNYIGCTLNSEGKYILSNNIFSGVCENNNFSYTYNNVLKTGCYKNIFGNDNYNNILEVECHDNTFGNNSFGNKLDATCFLNTFSTNCYGNTLGNNCHDNSFGDHFYYNFMGTQCNNNSFGDYNYNNTIGHNCSNIKFGKYIKDIIVYSGVEYIQVDGGSTQQLLVQNAQILNGTKGTSSDYLQIPFAIAMITTQFAALDGMANLKIWNPAD